jgi:type IV pilus assembly protein PilM
MGLPLLSSRVKKPDQVVAVDLGGRSTKAVHVTRRGEKFSLLNYAVLDTPIFEKNYTPDVLAEHLKSVIRAVNSRTKLVNLALNVSETLFRQVELPAMPVPDLRLMLKYNSKTYLQQDLPDYVFDCQFASLTVASAKPAEGQRSASPKQKVIVGGTRKQIIDDIQAAFKSAALIPDQILPGVIGPVNAFELAEPEVFKKEVIALVELGFRNSTITILDCGDIMLSRVVAIGGDRLTTGLAETMNISYQEAENIKVGMADEVMQHLEQFIHPLGRELRASIDFFENQHDKTVTKVYLSGGSVRGEQIVQSLQTELMVPCQLWTPTNFMELFLPPEKVGDLEQIAPQLTVAVGAAVVSF